MSKVLILISTRGLKVFVASCLEYADNFFTKLLLISDLFNEGMVHLLFVKDEKVIASILECSKKLGYRLDFSSKVTFTEDAQFNVITSDGVVILTYIKSA